MTKNTQPESVGWFSFETGRECFEFLFLSGIYGVIVFTLAHRFHFLNPSPNSPYFDLYIFGWAVCLPAGILLSISMKLLSQKWFDPYSFFCPFLILWNFIFSLYLLQPRWTLRTPDFFCVLLFFPIQWLGIILAKFSRSGLKKYVDLAGWIYPFLAAVFLFWFFSFNRQFIPFWNWGLRDYAVLLSGVLLIHFAISRATSAGS